MPKHQCLRPLLAGSRPLLAGSSQWEGFVDPSGCTRLWPATTLLYQLVEQHWPAFRQMQRERFGRIMAPVS
jgi:hypothetical protein